MSFIYTLLIFAILALVFKAYLVIERTLFQIRTILADINKSLNNGDYTGRFPYEEHYPNKGVWRD